MSMDKARADFESAVINRMKEGGFLEVEIRTECLVRSGDDYQDDLINYGWWAWQARTALDAQKSSPSDAELKDVWDQVSNQPANLIKFARALLSKYGAPVANGEPVHQVFHSDGRWEDVGAEARANCDDHGKETRTLYTAPANEQEGDPLQGAANWLIEALTTPNPTKQSPFQ